MPALTPERLGLQNRLLNAAIVGKLVTADTPAEQVIVTTEPYGDMATALVVYNTVGADNVSRRVSRRVRYRRKPLTDLLAALQDGPLNWSYDETVSEAVNQSRLNNAVAQVSPQFSGCSLVIVSREQPNQLAVSAANCPVFFGNGPIPISAPSNDALMRWNFASSVYHPETHTATVATTPQTIEVNGQSFPVHRCLWTGDLRGDEALHIFIPQSQVSQYFQTLCLISVKPRSQIAYTQCVRLASSLSSSTEVVSGDRITGQVEYPFGDDGREGHLVLTPAQGSYVQVYGRSLLSGINRLSLWRSTNMAISENDDHEFDVQIEFISLDAPISELQVDVKIEPFDETIVIDNFEPELINASYSYDYLIFSGFGMLDSDGDGVGDIQGGQMQWAISDDRRCRIVVPEGLSVGQSIEVALSDGPFDPANADLPTVRILSTANGLTMEDVNGAFPPQPVNMGEIVFVSADSSYRALMVKNGNATDLLPGNDYPLDPRITVRVKDPSQVGLPPVQITFVPF